MKGRLSLTPINPYIYIFIYNRYIHKEGVFFFSFPSQNKRVSIYDISYPYMIFPCSNIMTSPQITILVSSDTTRNKLLYKEGVKKKKKITPGKLQLLNEILLNNLLLICWHLFFCFPPLSNGLPCHGPSSSPIFYWKQSPTSKPNIISKIKTTANKSLADFFPFPCPVHSQLKAIIIYLGKSCEPCPHQRRGIFWEWFETFPVKLQT